jgi:two-component SAPR family response regulator
MLGLNGLELYERLIQIDSKVTVFFLTAYEIYKEALQQLLPNISKYSLISKPIELDDLIQRVRTEYESLR